MLIYKSYYNIAPSYLCELISRKESYVNIRLGTDHHQLIMPSIAMIVETPFLNKLFDPPFQIHNSASVTNMQLI